MCAYDAIGVRFNYNHSSDLMPLNIVEDDANERVFYISSTHIYFDLNRPRPKLYHRYYFNTDDTKFYGFSINISSSLNYTFYPTNEMGSSIITEDESTYDFNFFINSVYLGLKHYRPKDLFTEDDIKNMSYYVYGLTKEYYTDEE